MNTRKASELKPGESLMVNDVHAVFCLYNQERREIEVSCASHPAGVRVGFDLNEITDATGARIVEG